MKDQHMYEYLRQLAKLPMLKRHSFLEIEAAIDRFKGLPDGVSVRREKEMQFEQRLGKWYGFKAKAFSLTWRRQVREW